MAWIEAHQGLANHIKTIKLRKILRIKKIEAIGILFLLWWWAMDNAPSGDLSELDDADLAEIVEYKTRGKPTTMEALIEAGFIDENKHIHDWDDYIGKLVERRKTDAERKRNARGGSKSVPRTSDGHPTDIPRTAAGHPEAVQRMSGVTVPYRTEPYRTEPKEGITAVSLNIHEDPDEDKLSEILKTGDPPENPDFTKALRDCSDFYFQTTGAPMPMNAITYTQGLIQNEVDPELIKYAIAASQKKSKPGAYYIGVMRDKLLRGIKTMTQLNDALAEGKPEAAPPSKKQYFSDPSAYEGLTMDKK